MAYSVWKILTFDITVMCELVRVFQRIRKRKNGRYSPGPTLKVTIRTSVQIPLNKTQQCISNEIQRRLCTFLGTHISLDLMMCTSEKLKANHHYMEKLENLTINFLMRPRIQNHKYFGTNNDHLHLMLLYKANPMIKFQF